MAGPDTFTRQGSMVKGSPFRMVTSTRRFVRYSRFHSETILPACCRQEIRAIKPVNIAVAMAAATTAHSRAKAQAEAGSSIRPSRDGVDSVPSGAQYCLLRDAAMLRSQSVGAPSLEAL